MAGDDKWHEEEHEACVNVPGVSKGALKDAQFIQCVYRDKDCKRYKDAIAFVLERLLLAALLLFLFGIGGCHDSNTSHLNV